MISLRELTNRERIESGLGRIVGKLALLDGVIDENRNNGEWRRVKDQSRGRSEFDAMNGKRRRGEWPSRKQIQGGVTPGAGSVDSLSPTVGGIKGVASVGLRVAAATRSYLGYKVIQNCRLF